MGPKKKKGGKKEKSSAGLDPDESPLTIEEQNVFLLRSFEGLKSQLALETHKSNSAESVVRGLRTQLLQLQQDFQEEKKRTFDMVSDMTRQYKAMRETFVKDTGLLQSEINMYKDKLAEERSSKEELGRVKDAEIKLKEAEIVEQKKKTDDMAEDFTLMLTATLEKMNEKIAITTQWDTDNKSAPTIRTFEDFNLSLPGKSV